MGLGEDLLEQAKHLAGRDAKRPRQANLRRSISSAYYAAFHLLVSDGASYWKIASQQGRFARVFEHGRMRQAAERMAIRLSKPKAGDPPSASGGGTRDAILRVCENFQELQRERHRADYDIDAIWTRGEAMEVVKQAEVLFSDWG